MPPNPSNIPQVRTFEQDVAESMQSKQASVLHIALAEQEREKEVVVATKKNKVNLFIYFISFLFIFGAFGVIGYVYFLYYPNSKSSTCHQTSFKRKISSLSIKQFQLKSI
jgi:hypothetical protein